VLIVRDWPKVLGSLQACKIFLSLSFCCTGCQRLGDLIESSFQGYQLLPNAQVGVEDVMNFVWKELPFLTIPIRRSESNKILFQEG